MDVQPKRPFAFFKSCDHAAPSSLLCPIASADKAIQRQAEVDAANKAAANYNQ